MIRNLSLLVLFGILVHVPLSAIAAHLANWEGSHNNPSPKNKAVDWWYFQVVGQTPASNGIPPSIEVVLYHGNTFGLSPSNNPLYSAQVSGFDLNGTPFAQTFIFNSSSVTPTGHGLQTLGVWGDNEINFITNNDLTTFTITFNLITANITGTIVINSQSDLRTICGGTNVHDSPFFDSVVSDGRTLTAAETILYKQFGWRITVPGGPATVDLNFVNFTGAGYKDSSWSPYPVNDFIKSWYALIAKVGPWTLLAFSGIPSNGTNNVNSGHLSYNGHFLTSQCNIIGERYNDIAIITPSGEMNDSGVVAPTAFDVTFVLPDSRKISFHAANIAVNPSYSIYHRWVAKFTGGEVGEQQHDSYGIVEWMNPANLSHWPCI